MRIISDRSDIYTAQYTYLSKTYQSHAPIWSSKHQEWYIVGGSIIVYTVST